MTRSRRLVPASPWRRNLLAAVIVFVAAGLLYVQLQQGSVPLAADEGAVDVARLSADVPSPEPGGTGAGGAAQASIPDHPAGLESPDAKTILTGRLALLMNLLLLERGHARLEKTPCYTATFFKQERIGDELGEGTVMRLKLRHKPFSVYLKWLSGDKGRELIYVDGRYDGKMIVHVGGWKARLLPTVKLDPEGSTAMKESRHPVTQIGLLEVARRGIEHRKRDLKAKSGIRCRMIDNCRFDDRDCWCFVIEYDDEAAASQYRKTVVHIDKGYWLPVSVKNYGTMDNDAASRSGADAEANASASPELLETYSYTNIDLEADLTEADFDRHNEQYMFR